VRLVSAKPSDFYGRVHELKPDFIPLRLPNMRTGEARRKNSPNDAGELRVRSGIAHRKDVPQLRLLVRIQIRSDQGRAGQGS
jgi:hypothetical protein